jgi:hypothetical protein
LLRRFLPGSCLRSAGRHFAQPLGEDVADRVCDGHEEVFAVAGALDVCAFESVAASAVEYWLACFEAVGDEAVEVGDFAEVEVPWRLLCVLG